MAKLLSVQVAPARPVQMDSRSILTAIHKQPVAGSVAVMPVGLLGDEQADLWVHGGLGWRPRSGSAMCCGFHTTGQNGLWHARCTATHCNAEAFPSEPVTIHVQVLARGSTRNRTLSISPMESEGA